MNILVTGGAGYVGSFAAKLLRESGHEVWIYDNLVMGHRRSVPEDRLIVGDLLDQPKIEAALREQAEVALLLGDGLCERGDTRFVGDAGQPQEVGPERGTVFPGIVPPQWKEEDLVLIEAKVFMMQIVDLAEHDDRREDE